ncbi:MAG TPA: folylpolyglutamate synthase/dihydrofolate synthase family protein [Caulobacteraceae bacterium]
MTDDLRPHDAALERLKALHPRAIDLSLDRMQRLLSALGRPQDRLPPVVHVAGTNGKGSTVAFLRAIAEASGLKVHVFTSPHLVRFAERIRLAGRLIEEDRLSELLERVEVANAKAPITFFEITAAAAFTAFAEEPADLCLLEVGLGGRYDATNVVAEPELTVITPVDLDHREFLGGTVEEIALEKAGIIKSGRPVVLGRQRENAFQVLAAEAERLDAPVVALGQDFDAYADRDGMAWQAVDHLLDLPCPALFGPHQIDNAAVAVAAARLLRDTRVTAVTIAAGLKQASWPGRMQRLTAGPFAEAARARGSDLWLDGGHNPHAAAAQAEALSRLQARDGRPVTLIAGMLGNKDAAGFFSAYAGLRPRVLTVGFRAEAAADPRALADMARMVGLDAEVGGDLEGALEMALAAEGPPPRVLIAGSLYLAGEVLARSPETWPV